MTIFRYVTEHDIVTRWDAILGYWGEIDYGHVGAKDVRISPLDFLLQGLYFRFLKKFFSIFCRHFLDRQKSLILQLDFIIYMMLVWTNNIIGQNLPSRKGYSIFLGFSKLLKT